MRPFTVVAVLLVAAAAACKSDTIQSPADSRQFSASIGGIQARLGPPLFLEDCPPGFLPTPETSGSGADRNTDGFVCTKVAEGTIVTIDNNAKGPARKKA